MSNKANENEKGKVNQLDVLNKKDQHNHYNNRAWVSYNVKRQQNIAGNQNRNNQKERKKWLKSLCTNYR